VHILSESQEKILNAERQVLNDLRVALTGFGFSQEDQKTILESLEQLDELFLLVIVGEFNAGKSAFINALLGKPLLKEGVTPTTTHINLLKYGAAENRSVIDDTMHVLTLPIDWLSEISIVDTPGTNAIIRSHELITSKFVPRSDLVLFITSADRPFTESERSFLEKIRSWGKKVVIVINKIDLFQNEDELEQVERFITENALALIGMTPEIYPVSSRLALRAKLGESELWEASRFANLEKYIRETLDERGRLRLKLMNPLGVAAHLVDRYTGVIQERLDLLQDDISMLGDVDSQLALYREDMQRDFNFRMSDIENILFEMEQRGQEYFDDIFRFGRIFDLLNKERTRIGFEQKVVANTPTQIDRKVTELIDWLVESDLRQWRAVTDHLAERRKAHEDRIIGDPGLGTFHYDRERLIEGVGREAQRVVETFDKAAEAQSLAESAQAAVAASAAIEVSAVGLGTLITILATTATADVTGILMASVVAAIGLFVIPARRRQAKNELREKLVALRQQLSLALRTQFEREIERSMQRIQEAIAPYTRFVRAEQNKLEDTLSKLSTIDVELESLKVQIEQETA
jgi:small GTP-binding protein